MFTIDNFSANLVDYDCVRILDTETVWINSDESLTLSTALNGTASPQAFASFFSYIPQKNPCFNAEDFDLTDVRTYQAERYGGMGIGDNGGGGRVGNFGVFQIKGVGPNPTGKSASIWYSYGSLHLVDAAYEAIMSTVLNKLLPLGCVKTYGVIFTNRRGAFHSITMPNGEKSLQPIAGALLVREPSVRPAHFLRAEMFTPAKSSLLMRDSNRVRTVNRQLRQQFGSDNHYIKYLGKFILAAAKQFAFALAARITHGALTPSNLCLDGRWIDLTEVRFLSGGKNFFGLTPFYQDSQIVLRVIEELAHVYGKSNGVRFNTAPLFNYYQKMFDACFAQSAMVILGLPVNGQTAVAGSDDGKLVAKALLAVITANKTPMLHIEDVPDPKDPVAALIRTLYLSLANHQTNTGELAFILQRAGLVYREIEAAFSRLCLFPYSDNGPSAANQRLACAIKAWRWATLAAVFYKSRITSHLYYLAAVKTPGDIGTYISACASNAGWIFSTATTGAIPILHATSLQLFFDTSQGVYCLSTSKLQVFTRFADCLSHLREHYPALMLDESFDPSCYLRELSIILEALELAPATQHNRSR